MSASKSLKYIIAATTSVAVLSSTMLAVNFLRSPPDKDEGTKKDAVGPADPKKDGSSKTPDGSPDAKTGTETAARKPRNSGDTASKSSTSETDASKSPRNSTTGTSKSPRNAGKDSTKVAGSDVVDPGKQPRSPVIESVKSSRGTGKSTIKSSRSSLVDIGKPARRPVVDVDIQSKSSRRSAVIPPSRRRSDGFVDLGGRTIPGVVDPRQPILTIDFTNFSDRGDRILSRRDARKPIADANSRAWERLLAALILEVFKRPNGGDPISDGKSPGSLVASAESLKGLTFVRRGVGGNITHRLAFDPTGSTYTFMTLPSPGIAGLAAPETGPCTVTSKLLTLNPPGASPKRFSISSFRMNVDGKRSMQLGNDPWEEAADATPKVGPIVASDSTLNGKVFVRKSDANSMRLVLLDGNFTFVSAPLNPAAQGVVGAPLRQTKGTFTATATSLEFKPATRGLFQRPMPNGNTWAIANFERTANGKLSILLNREGWDEESPTPATPLGPITPSIETLGNKTFTWNAGGISQRLELSANGQFAYKVSGGGLPPYNGSGSYTMTSSNLSLTFSNAAPPPPSLGLVPTNIWGIGAYQMNADGNRTIGISNLDPNATTPSSIDPSGQNNVWIEEP